MSHTARRVRPRALLVQPSLNPPGGGNGVAAWILEALARDWDLSLLTRRPPDFVRINDAFGTTLSAAIVEVIVEPWTPPALLRRITAAGHFSLWQDHHLLALARTRRADYDLVLTANNEGDLGGPGVQYVHYPKFATQRPDAGLRWFQRPVAVGAYQRACGLLTGFRMRRMRSNVTLVNSAWTARITQRVARVTPHVVYPPIVGPFPSVPWHEREMAAIAIGRFARDKRLEDIIDIVARIRARRPEFVLHLAGHTDDAEYFRQVQAHAHAHGDWVRFHLNLQRPALLALMARCRIGLHAMRDEHFGMAVAELLRAGTIPFAHRSGGPPEILGDDPRLLFDNTEQAVSLLEDVLDHPDVQDDLRAALATRADALDVSRFVEQIRAVADACLAGPA